MHYANIYFYDFFKSFNFIVLLRKWHISKLTWAEDRLPEADHACACTVSYWLMGCFWISTFAKKALKLTVLCIASIG